MDKTKMVRVIVDGKEYSYPAGTSYRALAADFQDRYEYDILLADRDNISASCIKLWIETARSAL